MLDASKQWDLYGPLLDRAGQTSMDGLPPFDLTQDEGLSMIADANAWPGFGFDERTVSSLFAAIPDGIMVLNPAGTVLYANVSAQHMFGGRQLVGEYLGLPLTLGDRHSEIEYIDCAGRIGLAEMRSTQFDWLGQAAIAVSLRDTTARRELMDELALDRQIFASIQEGIMVTRLNGVIVRVNRAFEELSGYDAAEVVGATPRLLKSDRHSRAFYEQMWRSISENGFWRGQVVNRHRDGSSYVTSLSVSQIRDADGVLTHLVGVFSAIGGDDAVLAGRDEVQD